MKITIILSETFKSNDIELIQSILDETLSDFLPDNAKLINIECKTDPTGLSRFWIYYSHPET